MHMSAVEPRVLVTGSACGTIVLYHLDAQTCTPSIRLTALVRSLLLTSCLQKQTETQLVARGLFER